MCEWANEARGIIFNEPKLYADSTSKRRHMTTFATQNKEYHVMNSWAFHKMKFYWIKTPRTYTLLCVTTDRINWSNKARMKS